jgi:hypothetical protein
MSHPAVAFDAVALADAGVGVIASSATPAPVARTERKSRDLFKAVLTGECWTMREPTQSMTRGDGSGPRRSVEPSWEQSPADARG